MHQENLDGTNNQISYRDILVYRPALTKYILAMYACVHKCILINYGYG